MLWYVRHPPYVHHCGCVQLIALCRAYILDSIFVWCCLLPVFLVVLGLAQLKWKKWIKSKDGKISTKDDRCILGEFVSPYILETFTSKLHAQLITKTLKYHGLNPQDCETIMCTKSMGKSEEFRKQITFAYNKINNTLISPTIPIDEMLDDVTEDFPFMM